jgi:hypothetical protein
MKAPCKFGPPRLFKIWIHLRQYIGADMLFPPILLALWMFILWTYTAPYCVLQAVLPSSPATQFYSTWLYIPVCMYCISFHNILNRQSRSNGKLVSSYWQKFAPLRLFVETIPIYKAVTTENGKMSFKEKRHVQTAINPRSPQCQTEAELLSPPNPPLFSLPSTFKDRRTRAL